MCCKVVGIWVWNCIFIATMQLLVITYYFATPAELIRYFKHPLKLFNVWSLSQLSSVNSPWR